MDVSPNPSGSVKVDQATLNAYPTTTTIDSGRSISLEAVPASGYEFTGWSGDLTGKANPATLVMDCTKRITANFSRITHTLTLQVRGPGSVNPSAGDYSYPEGTVVGIMATPDRGQRFDGWTGAVGYANSANTTVTMDSYKIVIARFSQDKPNWLVLGAIIAAGMVVSGGIIWLATRRRGARA